MREALECWQIDMFKNLLPRIFQIVTEIDNRFRASMWEKTHDADYVARTAIVEGGVVKMANLCVAACHTVNGVSKLHTDILVNDIFADYYRLNTGKFHAITNGITFRRWIANCNPELYDLISSKIGNVKSITSPSYFRS